MSPVSCVRFVATLVAVVRRAPRVSTCQHASTWSPFIRTHEPRFSTARTTSSCSRYVLLTGYRGLFAILIIPQQTKFGGIYGSNAVGWLVGWLVGRSVSWSVGRSVGLSAVGWIASNLTSLNFFYICYAIEVKLDTCHSHEV